MRELEVEVLMGGDVLTARSGKDVVPVVLGRPQALIDRWRVIIWRLAASPGSSASKPQ
jgi:hypothetical protein